MRKVFVAIKNAMESDVISLMHSDGYDPDNDTTLFSIKGKHIVLTALIIRLLFDIA